MSEEKKNTNYALYLCIIIVSIWAAKYYLGTLTPGSIFERGKNYTARFYVLLYPENSTQKNYRLPADISKEGSLYSVTKVYWEKGGSLEFDNCQIDINSESKKDYCSYGDTDYEIQLTTERVRN